MPAHRFNVYPPTQRVILYNANTNICMKNQNNWHHPHNVYCILCSFANISIIWFNLIRFASNLFCFSIQHKYRYTRNVKLKWGIEPKLNTGFCAQTCFIFGELQIVSNCLTAKKVYSSAESHNNFKQRALWSWAGSVIHDCLGNIRYHVKETFNFKTRPIYIELTYAHIHSLHKTCNSKSKRTRFSDNMNKIQWIWCQ